MEYDVFISHASEDKVDVARPLAAHLQTLGLKVWLDDLELTLGDSLRRKIDQGLSRSRYGLVVLSPAFFLKEWPNKELDGLVAREDGRESARPRGTSPRLAAASPSPCSETRSPSPTELRS